MGAKSVGSRIARLVREKWEVQAESRVRAAEARLALEAQQKDEAAEAKTRQREQDLTTQLTAQAEARFADRACRSGDSESEEKQCAPPQKRSKARGAVGSAPRRSATKPGKSPPRAPAKCETLGEKPGGSIHVPQWLEKWKESGFDVVIEPGGNRRSGNGRWLQDRRDQQGSNVRFVSRNAWADQVFHPPKLNAIALSPCGRSGCGLAARLEEITNFEQPVAVLPRPLSCAGTLEINHVNAQFKSISPRAIPRTRTKMGCARRRR